MNDDDDIRKWAKEAEFPLVRAVENITSIAEQYQISGLNRFANVVLKHFNEEMQKAKKNDKIQET